MANIEQQRAGVDWFSLRPWRSEDSETYINTNVVSACTYPRSILLLVYVHIYIRCILRQTDALCQPVTFCPLAHVCTFITNFFFSLFNNVNFRERNARENCQTCDELLATINEFYKRKNQVIHLFVGKAKSNTVAFIALYNRILPH